MKRLQILLVGALIATSSLSAQSGDADWQAEAVRIRELIKTNPTEVPAEIKQLLKGKNRKNVDLILSIGRAYLDAGKPDDATVYMEQAKEVNGKSAEVFVLGGDIAIAKKDAGTACQLFEQAIYFDPKNEHAYLQYADVYKSSSPQIAIEKLEQLKSIHPTSLDADKKLAEIYYLSNDFAKAAEAYSRMINTPIATEDDLVKYAFALFLNHKFDESLKIANLGLQRNARHAAFNRLAMYNYVDLKRYDDAKKVADRFFYDIEKADYSYLDYMYYGHLLNELKSYDEAIVQYRKAIDLDQTKVSLWREVSNCYEQKNDYKSAIGAYQNYFKSLPSDEQTPDLQFQLGKLYYGKGTQSDTLTVNLAERKSALVSADSVFSTIAQTAPESYLGNFWRARANAALDPETTQGLAKPYYEQVAALLVSKNDPRYNSAIIECYSYLGYYYLMASKLKESKEYWNKILAIDPTNAVAKRALDGIK